ncbi:MAG: hypothetical protein ACJ8C4_20140 [Gemmataceae bacterium]
MNAGLLSKLFGSRKQWSGPCTVMLDADASIQASGSDSIVNAGIKNYAPRLISGRLTVDSVCYLPEEQALVMVQVNRIRQSGGQDRIEPTYYVADLAHVAAIEFAEGSPIEALEISPPPARANSTNKAHG